MRSSFGYGAAATVVFACAGLVARAAVAQGFCNVSELAAFGDGCTDRCCPGDDTPWSNYLAASTFMGGRTGTETSQFTGGLDVVATF